MKTSEIEKQAAIEIIKNHVKPGDTISCVLRHVSRSGMMRHISFFANHADGGLICLDYQIGKACDYKQAKGGPGIKVSGCGMDMGFAVVYELGQTLWPRGTDKPHGTRNGEPDSNGGYALTHRWI
jgi:hypothetical protein